MSEEKVSRSSWKKLAIGGAVALGVLFGVLAVLFTLLIWFSPGLFNDLILRPFGVGVDSVTPVGYDTVTSVGYDTATASCDDHLKTVINPRTGSFGATSDQVNDAILEVQIRYPEECHYTNWNVVAADGQTFGDGTGENQCFKDEIGGVAVSASAAGKSLYVGRVTLPTAFYDASTADPTTAQLTPKKETRRDAAGDVIVFFDPAALPLDGSHCWLFRAGRLNQWFSNRDQ